MPAIKKISFRQGIAGIWRISETPDELAQIVALLPGDADVYNRFKHPRRKAEFLAVRALLAELTGENLQVVYTEAGKPQLPGAGWQISISHSSGLAALILGRGKVGIDVESLGRPLEKIEKKFLSEQEIAFVKNSEFPEKVLLLCWCAKEAVFKLVDDSGIDFREQIEIDPFQINDGGIIQAVYKNSDGECKIQLNYTFIENNALAWCVLNENFGT